MVNKWGGGFLIYFKKGLDYIQLTEYNRSNQSIECVSVQLSLIDTKKIDID